MRPHFKRIIFSAILIFLAFSPSIFAELSTVDDLDAYNWVENGHITLKSLFFPHISGGGYYRPLIGISYLFDKYVWLLDTRLMHLDNIFFHIFNALLVYWIASLLIRDTERHTSFIPLIASLMFGLHPITTESVDWISGRTDAIACTFILLSTVFILKYKTSKNISFLFSAILILVPGILVKETTIAFILGLLFILYCQYGTVDVQVERQNNPYQDETILCLAGICAASIMLVTYNVWLVFLIALVYFCSCIFIDKEHDRKAQLKLIICTGLIATGAIISVLFIRKLVFVSNLATIPRTLKLITDDWNYALQTFFGAAGFYIKKFFLPFPLNFAIREVDPLYNVVGVILFFVCIYWFKKRTTISSFYLSGVCLSIPALPLSLGTVTWTGYAERYIYISSAFWAVATVLWFSNFLRRIENKRLVVVTIASFLFLMGVVTFQRSILWQTNLSLLKDTVEKSPNFKSIRVDYMQVLMNHGDLKGATEQYYRINSIPTIGYAEKPDLLMAAILTKEHKYGEASDLYETVIKKTRDKSPIAYAQFVNFLQERYNSLDKENNSALAGKTGLRILQCMEKLYLLNKDPMTLYRAGQWALILGYKEKSREYFSEASRLLPKGDIYSVFASKLASNKTSTGRQVDPI